MRNPKECIHISQKKGEIGILAEKANDVYVNSWKESKLNRHLACENSETHMCQPFLCVSLNSCFILIGIVGNLFTIFLVIC